MFPVTMTVPLEVTMLKPYGWNIPVKEITYRGLPGTYPIKIWCCLVGERMWQLTLELGNLMLVDVTLSFLTGTCR